MKGFWSISIAGVGEYDGELFANSYEVDDLRREPGLLGGLGEGLL